MAAELGSASDDVSDSPSAVSQSDEASATPQSTPGVVVNLMTLRSDYYHLFDLLGVAENSLANACMIDSGFEPLVLALPPERTDQRDYIGELGRLALTEEQAKLDGYGSTALSREQNRVDPREELQRNLDTSVYNDLWFDAWQGSEDPLSQLPEPGSDRGSVDELGGVGGCVGEAQDQIRQNYDAQGLVTALRSTEQLWGDVFSRSEVDEEYLSALGKWSDCMREAGFDFVTLIDAYGAARQVEEAEPQLAFAQAVSDARCQAASNVISVYDGAWIENQLLVQNSDEALALFAWHQDNFDDTLDGVVQVLEESGLPISRD